MWSCDGWAQAMWPNKPYRLVTMRRLAGSCQVLRLTTSFVTCDVYWMHTIRQRHHWSYQSNWPHKSDQFPRLQADTVVCYAANKINCQNYLQTIHNINSQKMSIKWQNVSLVFICNLTIRLRNMLICLGFNYSQLLSYAFNEQRTSVMFYLAVTNKTRTAA